MVEGGDDQRFFKGIIEQKLRIKYNWIETISYAKLKKEKVINYIKSITDMEADYIYVSDINHAPCVTYKKQGVQDKLGNIDKDKMIIVIKEIEGWYLAGLSDIGAQKLKIKASKFTDTDNLTKEQFNNLIPERFGSRVDFLIEILKNFSIDIAKQKNKSFRYFIDNYTC